MVTVWRSGPLNAAKPDLDHSDMQIKGYQQRVREVRVEALNELAAPFILHGDHRNHHDHISCPHD